MIEVQGPEMGRSMLENPLLAMGGLPRFDRIEVAHVVPAIRSLLEELSAEFEALEASVESTWAASVIPLEAIGERLSFSWGIVGHLMGVRNSDELRAAYEEVQAEVVGFTLRMGQSRPIYRALEALKGGEEWDELNSAQRRIVEGLQREGRHSGVALNEPDRERFNEIQRELVELGTDFANHVLDATQAFSLWLREPEEMLGVPGSLRKLSAQAARDAGEAGATADAGPWKIGLDQPSIRPFLEHAERRDLRERAYRAYVSRAGSGEYDNSALIGRILGLRRESARLLDYDSYAELALSSRMAGHVAEVSDFLERLRGASADAAAEDFEALGDFALRASEGEVEDLRHWDIAFWAERLREEEFAYSEEDLRAYFPLPKVLKGLFSLAQRLFGIEIEEADGETSLWHPDVRFFRIRDEKGVPIAAFFLDPYSRPGEKRGGAWMDECVGRSRRLAAPGESMRLPVAYLVCNQASPVDGQPSLMSFQEVTTLFHEFGHGLQHMLTRVDESMAAGIRNIEWDAVELPSQFMENWCYQRETLREISGHVVTGAPLPDELFEKLRAARNFRSGSDMLRQLYFACTDLALHDEFNSDGPEDAFEIQRRIAALTTVLPPLPEDRFLCSFGHIFAGGYAAGYYSYKWAEVLSADAFGAFEEAGLEDSGAVKDMGRRFRESVLALGGSRDPMEIFRDFRGRPPGVEALLRQSGLERS